MLPENFTLEKYGLKARLVNESDAPYSVFEIRSCKNTIYAYT